MHSEQWTKLFGHRTKRNGECIEFVGAKDKKGYGRVWHGSKVRLAHRVSFELSRVDATEGLMVCHHCDNPACINPAHLFLGEHADNTSDMLVKGRSQKQWGAGHSQVKLTEDQVVAIRLDDRPYLAIAADYGISRSSVGNIKSGHAWGRLKSEVVANGYAKGSRVATAKLSEDLVRQIRSDTRSQQQIADDFGVARTTVGRIKRGETWGGV